MKKILIAGSYSGVGKTTISLGLMKALSKRGKKVQPFKVGPDYIDPMYHRFVTGEWSRNLDSYMLDDEQIKFVFKNSSEGKDISVIEGVMGLYDGIGTEINKHSTSQMSKILKSPVILVIDGKGMGASAGAMVLGYKQLDKDVEIVGVIANNVRTQRHYNIIKESIERFCGIEVLGYLPPDENVSVESRNLGLFPSNEIEDLERKVNTIADEMEKHIDIDRIIELSESENVTSSFELNMFSEDPEVRALAEGKTVAVAYDKAFNFYYPDNIDLFKEIGANIITFSPINDEEIPEADLLYMGGGFPEVFAEELEKNVSMRKSIKKAHDEGLAIYAECGGLMYLGDSLVDMDGKKHEMVGAISGYSEMKKGLRRFGYCIATAKEDNLISYKGQEMSGHEFHSSEFYSDLDTAFTMKKVVEDEVVDEWEGGYYVNNTLASYLHIHFYNNLSMVCYLLSNVKNV
ncbi:cobyrinic acid a,c-diamide synthase [Peptostreptococcus russellii]|uniref:Cobyrinate a,c-diamide synthase n=1 Tax=Peptostreptococcus russellii TaxID=215200 RepID=A0A2P7PYQ3_9FIRM|nr:cobyrinate a,c-diamide synthase [Peptostreptococcus russellii]PSJ30838.1 cobyrinic acid a,c-diamide synthase [Peptostreptococcus russellii]